MNRQGEKTEGDFCELLGIERIGNIGVLHGVGPLPSPVPVFSGEGQGE